MGNIDKEKVNNNINDAYKEQTESVKELLEFAKQNLENKKDKKPIFLVKKQNAEQIYKVNRISNKNKKVQSDLEEKIDTKFIEIEEKLNINSKNLDFIFKNVSDNNDKQVSLITDLNRKQEANIQSSIKDINEEFVSKFIKKQMEAENKLLNAQTEAENKIINSQENVMQKIYQLNNNSQAQIRNDIINEQKANKEELMKYIQKQNEKNFMDLKEEMIRMYKNGNKYSINTLLDERREYIKELEEKDKRIRELNYMLYDIQEKLEKEKEKRYKTSIWSIFTRKDQYEEEEPIYTSQILSYVCQES